MRKIVKLTERDLTRIVKRVIKENEMESKYDTNAVDLEGESEETVSEVLNNLSGSEKYIRIENCEYADFSNIDICETNVIFMNLKGTPNNFEETQNEECYTNLDNDMYDINSDNESLYENNKVKKVLTEELINEKMDNDEASFMFRKLQQTGEDMDNTYRRVKSIRDELNERIFRRVREETATDVFDFQIRTPHDVVASVMSLKGQLNALESDIMEYKRIVERSISL